MAKHWALAVYCLITVGFGEDPTRGGDTRRRAQRAPPTARATGLAPKRMVRPKAAMSSTAETTIRRKDVAEWLMCGMPSLHTPVAGCQARCSNSSTVLGRLATTREQEATRPTEALRETSGRFWVGIVCTASQQEGGALGWVCTESIVVVAGSMVCSSAPPTKPICRLSAIAGRCRPYGCWSVAWTGSGVPSTLATRSCVTLTTLPLQPPLLPPRRARFSDEWKFG
jgi:hypothetical protein